MSARILAYHRVCDGAAPGLESWSVRPSVFRRQMTLLKKLGYHGVPVNALLDALERGAVGEKLIGLSFDDGYLDTVEHALPILQAIGFAGSVYIVPDAVGGETTWEAEGARSRLAGWSDLRKLADAGWEIGMHSCSHPARLDLLTGPELELEVRGGLQRIEETLGIRVETFAFPHGHYSAEAVALIERAGYCAALTRDPGTVTSAASRFLLPRYEIKRRDTLLEFAFMLWTGIAPRRRATFARLAPARLNGRAHRPESTISTTH